MSIWFTFVLNVLALGRPRIKKRLQVPLVYGI